MYNIDRPIYAYPQVWIVHKLSVHECNVVEMLGTPTTPPGTTHC